MIKYEVIPLRGNYQIDINGIRFDGKSFMFWKKKSTQIITEVAVIFNKEHENMPLRDGMMVLSLKGLTSYQDLKNAMMIFFQVVRQNQKSMKLQFVVDNENQKQVAETLGKELGIVYEIHLVESKSNENIKQTEEKLNNHQSLTASGSKTLEIEKETGVQKITVQDDKAYVNSGMLSLEEEKYLLLQEWKKDPYMMNQLSGLSEQEIDRMLTERVTSNLTTYRMESSREQNASDKVGQVAMDKAIYEDGLVNAQLGIVENNISNSNQYSAVEQRGKNVQVVNPNVTSSEINSGGVTGSASTSGDVDYSKYNDSNLVEENEKSRENFEEFYLDEEYYIYDVNGNVLGRIGVEGYSINYDDNTLIKDGQVIGNIGDYKDMGKDVSNERKNINVRKKALKNPDTSAAFVSFPVIIFILSALLLIASLVLLFVLD